jgi:hypothetical protein
VRLDPSENRTRGIAVEFLESLGGPC